MDLTRFAEAAERLHVLGIKVTKDDELIGEWYYEPECRRNVYSATKSFTSCAVGFAVQEGLLSLDEKLTDAFREDLPDVVAQRIRDLDRRIGALENAAQGDTPPTASQIAARQKP